jgi:hypothetical protein
VRSIAPGFVSRQRALRRHKVKKFVIPMIALSVLLLGASNPLDAKGRRGTAFEVYTSISCDGVISWSATVGTQATQIVWVKIDGQTVAMQSAPDAGTYSGIAANGYVAADAHTVVFRRVAEAKVEEQATLITGACY